MINNHHLSRYHRLVNYYKSNLTEGYCERHHIIPKCMGGTDDVSNLVLMPSRAHIISHELLTKAYPESRQLKHAFAQMCVNNPHQNRRYSSRQYELGRIARSEALRGVPRPEWVREKLRVPKHNNSNYKKPKTPEHAAAISRGLSGLKKTPEHIAKLVESRSRSMKAKTTIKRDKIRTAFIASGQTRHEFWQGLDMSYSTLKRYLRGL